MRMYSVLGSDPSQLNATSLQEGTVRRVWGWTSPYRAILVGFVVTVVAAAGLGLVPPLLSRTIIDDALPSGDKGQLATASLLVIGAAVLSAGLSLLERWWSSRIGEGLIFDLRVALFDHVQRMPLGFFTRTQTGALISRLNNDVIGAQRAVTGTLGSVISNGITLATTLVALFALEWRLTLLSLILLPVFVVPAKRVGRRLQAITREGMNLNASMNTTMTERFNVSGAQLVKLFGRHDQEYDEFSGRAGQVRDIGIRSAIYGRTFMVALTLVGAVGMAVIYWLGGQMVIDGTLTTGTLVAMAALVVRIYEPLTSLTNARIDVMTAFVSFERVFEVLDAPNPIVDKPGAVALAVPRGLIELDHVSFRYPGDSEVTVASLEVHAPTGAPSGSGSAAGGSTQSTRSDQAAGSQDVAGAGEPDMPLVLRDVSAKVEPGQLVALVGPSGAGKTTLASLVTRLYDVTGGAIRVDGHDVRDVTQESLRAAIGVVSQDPHLFHASVAENLLYADPAATIDDLRDACRSARILDVIERLPDGFDTVVGERGYRLSGGEKQRLAIARLLVKDPSIVVLDEATSHLDSENEALVQEALAEALAGRTALVIAHRLSTITAADQILVLDQGAVVERGTHTELLAAEGLYADLYRILVGGDLTPELPSGLVADLEPT